MTLREWLIVNEMSTRDFSRAIGVSDRAVHRYLRGEREPRREVMARIVQITDGAVTRNDFYHQVSAHP